MNLIIDIGNTQIKLAVFNDDNRLEFLKKTYHSGFFDTLMPLLNIYPVHYAMISQVGKPIDNIERFFNNRGIKLWFLSANLKLPFRIAYKTAETLGADRIGLVAGAVMRQNNANQLIIDAGTCVTYDFVDENNVYQGGAISPGLNLRYKALNDYTANLPMLEAPEKTIKLTGYDTISSIHSGVVLGLTSEIEQTIVKYNLKFKDLKVYLTGGDKKLLDRYIKNKIFVDSKFLLLEGINFILNLNK